MKTVTASSIIFMGLLSSDCCLGQGTIYASNLGNETMFVSEVGSDGWLARSFVTGTNGDGYRLDAVDLLMLPATGSPSGFNVSVHDSAGTVPGNLLGSLTGPDPSGGGVAGYLSDGLVLSPSTSYFVVATAETAVDVGSYSWSAGETSLYESIDGWRIGPYTGWSFDGEVWTRGGGSLQMAIHATAIPEPSTLALIVLGGLLCSIRFRRSA